MTHVGVIPVGRVIGGMSTQLGLCWLSSLSIERVLSYEITRVLKPGGSFEASVHGLATEFTD